VIRPAPKPEKKPKAKKRKKKTPKEILEETCHNLWADCVKTKHGYVCQMCGTEHIDKATVMSGHHIRTKRNHAYTRYMVRNGLCLCFRCHSGERYQQEAFMDKIIDIVGQDEYDALRILSKTDIKYSIADLEEIKKRLEKELINIKDGLDFNNLPF